MKLRTTLGSMAAAAAIMSLAACGGGGGGGAVPSTGSQPVTPISQSTGKAAMSILIPARAGQTVKGKYISASTKSVTVGILNGSQVSQLAEADLTPSSTGCSSLAGGGVQCNVLFVGPAGTDTFRMTMYDQVGGKGNVLSTGDVAATLVANQNTSVKIALDGTPVSSSVVLGSGSLPVGTAGSTSVTVMAKDADGNIIVGPGGYSTGISLAITGDTYATLSLSEQTVNSPGQVVTLSYNGGSNVGSTITPSIGATAGSPATFNGTGASENLNQYFDTANGTYLETYDIAVAPLGATNMTPGNAAVSGYYYNYSGASVSADVIAVADPKTGVSKIFAGDTSDPFNPPAVGSLTIRGATVVHGMNTSLEYDEFDDYDDVAVGADGTILYSTSFSTSSDPQCTGSESTGGIGMLNPATGTTVEKSLKGYPGPIKVDTAGNVYWVEWSGTCAGVNMLGADTYAIGKMTPSGTITETKFSTAGIPWTWSSHYPGDMNVTPDGTQMFIVDDESPGSIAKVATASMSGATIIQTTAAGEDPYGVAAANDGSVLWYTDSDPENEYVYGYEQGGTAHPFGPTNEKEAVFPEPYAFAYNVAYADGSYWFGIEEYGSGLGRISNVANGAPVTGFYPNTTLDDYYSPTWNSTATGAGYVWMADYDYYNIGAVQYGAPSGGTLAFASRRAAARPMMPSFPHRIPANSLHRVNPHGGPIPAKVLPH